MLLIALTAATDLIILKQVTGTGPENGQNKRTFNSLCALVLAAHLDNPKVETPQAAQTALTAAKHISTLLEHGADINNLAKQLKENAALEKEQFPTTCKEEHAGTCKQAASWLNNLPEQEQAKLLAATADRRGFKQQINQTVQTLTALATVAGQLKISKTSGDAAAKLQEAVYGKAGEIPRQPSVSSAASRQASCGTADTTPGTMADASVLGTIVCLCASDAGNGGGNKGCYDEPTPAQTFSAGEQSVAGWATILAACQAAHPNHEQVGYKLVAAALTSLERELYTTKGSTGIKNGILGAIHGDASGSCTGQHLANNGACAMFKTSADAIKPPAWMAKIRQAINEIDKTEAARAEANYAAAQVHALNETLTTLLNLNAMEALKQPASPTQANKPPSGDSKKQEEEAEKECNKKEKDTDCTAPCTWDGEAKPPKKKCTLSEDAKKQVEKANQETKGKDGKTNTTGSNSFVIKKAPLLLAFFFSKPNFPLFFLIKNYCYLKTF
uniref:Variant surface glycoprotein n=1 Tax=Trypanosoma brucei TaxID=5691 RepID=A0A1V0G0G0_9TRYP|nr:variant surface glycoprotein [Trypanosoma brucei]